MGLFLHEPINPAGEIGIWEITESEKFFLEEVDLYPEERAQFDLIKGRKRIEWLAARYLVHYMSGREKQGRMAFTKDEFGKPHLNGSKFQISISHSHEMAAAIAAPASLGLGIDIQYLIAKISRIAKKFTRPEERAIIKPDTELEHLHVYWGAKEALYKAYGRRRLDFCKHLLVEPFEYQREGGVCRGQVIKEDYNQFFDLQYRLIDQYMLVYTVR